MFTRTHHILILCGLLALGSSVQGILIHRATVPALDAVRFVDIAQRIDRHGVLPTLRNEAEQPLFPLAVWLTHKVLEPARGDSPSNWALSAQLAAATALVLAAVPVYLVSLRLVGPLAGLAGSILFCLLPEVSRLGADGISDSTHLLFFSLALWAAVSYLGQSGKPKAESRTAQTAPEAAPPLSAFRFPLWLPLAGLATAAAILTRAEVVILPLALAVTLIVFQFRPQHRQTWPRLAAAAGSFTVGFALLFGPYLVAADALTPQVALQRALGRYRPPDTPAASQPPAWQLPDGRSMSFDRKEPTVTLRRRGYTAATALLAEELADGYGYWLAPLAILGLVHLRGALTRPESRFLQCFCILFFLVLLRFTAAEGYLSARHLLMLVIPGVGCAGCGLLLLGRLNLRESFRDRRPVLARRPRAARLVVALASIACLLQTARPLHAGRMGHRAAARWLETEAPAAGAVLDTRGWTGLYSGRATYPYDQAQTAFRDPGLAYVVLEQRELHYPSDRARTLRSLLGTAARHVASFPDPAQESRCRRVVVFRWSADRFSPRVAGRSASPHETPLLAQYESRRR